MTLLETIREPSQLHDLMPQQLETLAREMMAKDPALKAEFEAKVHADAAFAAEPTDARSSRAA